MLKEKDATLYDISVLKQKHKVNLHEFYDIERGSRDRERKLLFL
jgi:hypothetical protein